MKLSSTAPQLLFVAGLAYAQEAFETAGPGPYDNASIWQDANGSPVAEKSIQFPLYENGPQWTWRVSVAEAQISDSPTPNAQQLSQIYAFEWPTGGSLSDAVAQNPSNLNQTAFCVTVVESLFPKGTTDSYDDGSDPASSCESPLRTRCLNAIVDAARDAEPGDNGCKLTNVDLGNIRQCEWTFEHEYQASTYNLLGPNIASQAANGTFPIDSGEGFAHITTDTYDGSNTTYQDSAESRLQMVVIDSGNILQPLCLRINTNSDVGTLEGAAPVTSLNGWFAGAAALFAAAYLL